ncbi:MAG: hypothetical protein WDZ41_04950 [Candidatus Babeliales bacterium]
MESITVNINNFQLKQITEIPNEITKHIVSFLPPDSIHRRLCLMLPSCALNEYEVEELITRYLKVGKKHPDLWFKKAFSTKKIECGWKKYLQSLDRHLDNLIIRKSKLENYHPIDISIMNKAELKKTIQFLNIKRFDLYYLKKYNKNKLDKCIMLHLIMPLCVAAGVFGSLFIDAIILDPDPLDSSFQKEFFLKAITSFLFWGKSMSILKNNKFLQMSRIHSTLDHDLKFIEQQLFNIYEQEFIL